MDGYTSIFKKPIPHFCTDELNDEVKRIRTYSDAQFKRH